jgi:hypothetical protein
MDALGSRMPAGSVNSGAPMKGPWDGVGRPADPDRFWSVSPARGCAVVEVIVGSDVLESCALGLGAVEQARDSPDR